MEIHKNGTPISWEEFLEEAEKLDDDVPRPSELTPWLFRGQANENCGLETSLERYLIDLKIPYQDGIQLRDYYEIIQSIVFGVNSQAPQDFPQLDLSSEEFVKKSRFPIHLPYMEFLCYLRHHGFPTPLLDWSLSKYIASYFAFFGATDKDVAIFAFTEYPNHMRTSRGGDPMIYGVGEYLKTHPRHYRQQSNYTYCLADHGGDGQNSTLFPHERAVKINSQDNYIKKFVIQGSERHKVMSELMKMNINSFSLFGNEEGLLQDLAFKEFKAFKERQSKAFQLPKD